MTSVIRPNQFLTLLFSFFFLMTGCNAAEQKPNEQKAKTTPAVETKKSGEKMSSNPKIKLETSKGTMVLELDAEKAPKSSENFGGGMNPDMSEKGNKTPIQNEANNGLKNDRDNDFLNHTSESPAGWGYAVFGKVVDGLDVIDEIAAVKTGVNALLFAMNKTYFISDLHLDPSQPHLYKLFHEFIEKIRNEAEALYILGDLFEFWIGDDIIDLPIGLPKNEKDISLEDSAKNVFINESQKREIKKPTQIRKKTSKQTKKKAYDILDVNQQAVEKALKSRGVSLLIHGHTHRPA
ncbi:Peptidyl-prolyl cis-trans isomerase cyp18 [Nymphon striatum]|nr:Peptidyl-prolyl cis-trans isomerase cyp18 [Nymphon striatum]